MIEVLVGRSKASLSECSSSAKVKAHQHAQDLGLMVQAEDLRHEAQDLRYLKVFSARSKPSRNTYYRRAHGINKPTWKVLRSLKCMGWKFMGTPDS